MLGIRIIEISKQRTLRHRSNNKYSLTLYTALTLLVFAASFAQASPESLGTKPPRRGGDLEQIKSQIDEGKKSLENLDEQIEQIEQENQDIQKKVILIKEELFLELVLRDKKLYCKRC